MDLTICPAKPEDAELLTNIAISAKRYWGYPERWIEIWLSELTISEVKIASHRMFKACRGTETLGFYSLAISADLANLEHMWVKPEVIGQGVGRALWEDAAARARAYGARRMEVVSDPNAAGFYRRMGMVPTSEVVYPLDGRQRRLPRLSVDLMNSRSKPVG